MLFGVRHTLHLVIAELDTCTFKLYLRNSILLLFYLKKASIVKVLSEAVDSTLQSLAAVEIRGELGAGQEAEVLGFGLPADCAHRHLAHLQLEGGGAVGSGGQEEAGDDELLVRLQVALIVFSCVGRAAEEADKRVASWSSSIRSGNSRLDGGDVGREGGGQLDTWPIYTVPSSCSSANQAMGHNYFNLVGAFAGNCNTQASLEVLQDVAVEAGVQLLLGHWQDVVQDVLPGLRVQGAPEVGAVVALDHHLGLPIATFSCHRSSSTNLGHNIVQAQTVREVILSDWLSHVGLRLENLLGWLCVLLGSLRHCCLLLLKTTPASLLLLLYNLAAKLTLHRPDLLLSWSQSRQLVLIRLHSPLLLWHFLQSLLTSRPLLSSSWLLSTHCCCSPSLLCCLGCLARFLRSILVLCDLDRFLPLVVRVVGDVLNQGVDQGVLVQGL